MGWSSWAPLVPLAAGVACLSLAGTQLAAAGFPPSSFGATSAPPAASSSSRESTARPDRLGTTRTPGRPTAAASLGDPVTLAIPALHLVAWVQQVASAGGDLPVPADPHLVGWWTGSARPGAPEGSVVMDGHIDSAREGPGALFYLTDLGTGDVLVVTTTRGQVSYRVIGRRVYAKATGLPPDLFQATPAPRLVLISCGGPFDRRTRSYQENLVVFAVPV
jgi:hypothetical protein